MAPPLTKVMYQHDSQSTEEFTIFVNPEEYQKWKDEEKSRDEEKLKDGQKLKDGEELKDGITSTSVNEVVAVFKVYHSSQGAQGKLLQPSQQQLDTAFGTHDIIEVITYILKHGKEQHGGTITSSSGTLNISRGSVSIVDGRNKRP